MALYEIGEIRLRRGNLDGADETFRRADDLGKTPQPGLTLLHLARGKVEAAMASISGAPADESWDRLTRARLIPAAVEIAVAAGDVERAAAFAEELEGIVRTYGTTALERRAIARAPPSSSARARLALAEALWAEGDREGAATEARAAVAPPAPRLSRTRGRCG